VKSFFSSPVFPGDDDKTLAASMVHHGIIFGLIANLFNIPALILAGDPPRRILVTSAILVLTLFLNLYFLRKGYVRSSGATFLTLAWVALAFINYTAGGVAAPGFSIHVVFIICVGFIFGRRWAFLGAALSTVLGAWFVSLAQRGLLPLPAVHNTPGRYWLIHAANFFIIAAILTMMVNRLRRSIAEGRAELRVRQEAERKLARHQETLEETIRERTTALKQTNATLEQEVQERRLAEEALRREKDFIGQLMETSPVGILVVDGERRFSFANAAAEFVLGRPREEITRLSCTSASWRFTNYDGVSLGAEDLPFERTMSVGVALRNIPLAVTTRDGRRVLLSVNTDPLGADKSNPSGCVVTVEDVTERVRLEQEVLRTQKLESVGVLAGGIAHDFNNLLTGIMGNISLAQLELPAGGALSESLADAEKATMQARELTQQLLTFSRGGAPIKRTIDIREIVATAAQFTLRGANVRAELEISPDLWAVEADHGQISQVFHNLVINASQSMPQGGTVRLAASNAVLREGDVPPLPAGRYVKVTVADHGVGIPSENLTKIFDPFFSTKKGGTGLGLAVVFSIVKKHGGKIEVASLVGEGTTFTLLLPAAAGVAAAAAPPTEALSGKGRILLMDDEPIVRQVVAKILKTLGYEVETSAEGSEAIAAYRHALADGKPFDAVILDLTVPGGMGGAEAIGLLRTVDPNVKAVVSSGYSSNPVMSNYRDYGFAGVIAKPYQANDLSAVLRLVIAEDRGTRSPSG
jgi:PAS domain S-box-containing protein